MKFRKEIIIFSLIMIFMLMSAVSAEENITVDDGADSTSDYVELESDQCYDENNISENPLIDDDENISEGAIEHNACPGSFDRKGASADYGFNDVAYDSASLGRDIAIHKASSCSHFSKADGADVGDNEYNIDGRISNFQSLEDKCAELLNEIIHTEDIFADSSCGEVNSDYSDYSFYQYVDLIINSYDLNDEMGLFIESDSNILDMLIIRDSMTLMNQTFDLNAINDVSINSDDGSSDLQLSDEAGSRDAHDNSDKTGPIQSLKFIQQFILSRNMSEDIQNTFYHIIGCECTSTSFTKQHNSYDNLPKVSEFDTITRFEQEDNHDIVLFKKYNVDSPFIVENTSIFALFGVIEITIP